MTLNFGLYCLMRLFSSANAWRSFSTRIVSRSAISRASEPVFASTHRDSRKYERTRLRSDRAFPTYTTFPAASLKRYTPGDSGSAAAFSRGSMKLKRRGRAFQPPLSSYGEFQPKEKHPPRAPSELSHLGHTRSNALHYTANNGKVSPHSVL